MMLLLFLELLSENLFILKLQFMFYKIPLRVLQTTIKQGYIKS
jgi:hypothetical protein